MTQIALSPVAVDQEDLRTQLQNILATKDAWSGYLPTQTGQTLIDMIATVGAFAHMKSMRYAQDAFSETAVSSRALYSIAEMQGVRISRKIAASVSCTITYAPTEVGAPTTVTIPRFSQFQAAGTYWYNKDAVVVTPTTPGIFSLYQGYLVDQTMAGLGLDYSTFLSVEKGFVVDDQTVYVVLNGTDVPRAVDGLWNYPGRLAFLDKTSPDGRLRILFGNASYGAKPQPTDILRIIYAVTSGADANSISAVNSNVTMVTGTPHGVAFNIVTNPSGGANEPDPSLYKTVGAYNFGDFGASVTPSQCLTTARSYPGVLDIKMFAQRQINSSDYRLMNTVKVVGLTSSLWSQQNITDFLQYMQEKSMYALSYYWVDPAAVPIDVEFTVYCYGWASLTQCQADAIAAVNLLFEPKAGSLGRDVPLSDIYDVIKRSNTGIEYLELVKPAVAQTVSGNARPAPVVTQLPETSVFNLAAVDPPIVSRTNTDTPGLSNPGFPIGNYSFVVTAVTTAGETAAINYTTLNVPTLENSTVSTIDLTWPAWLGASSYKIYGSVPGSGLGLLATTVLDAHTFTPATLTVDPSQQPEEATSVPSTPVSSNLTPLSYSYVITAITTLGETAAVNYGSTVVTTSNDKVNHITWEAMSGALQYRVYGRSGPNYGLLAVTTKLAYDDWGQRPPNMLVTPPVATTYPPAYLTLNSVVGNARFSTRS